MKSKNNDWNTNHVELRRYLEKNGTIGRFGISHLSLWTDLIIEGTVSGPEEEPDWSKYKHIVQVDPMPKRGFGLSKSVNSSTSSQDLLTVMMMQQESRYEEERKEQNRRRDEEKRWKEMDERRQERHQEMLTALLTTQLKPPPIEKVQGRVNHIKITYLYLICVRT